MARFRARQLKFALKIRQSYIKVLHGHLGRGVAEQFHQGWKANASSKHFCGIGMPQLMWDDADGKAKRMADLM